MALNDCWWWLDAMFQPESEESRLERQKQERRRAIGCIAIIVVVLVVGAAAAHRSYVQMSMRRAAERRLAEEVEATRALVQSVVDHGHWYEAWNRGEPVRDAWDVDLRITETPGFLDRIEVRSAGPDLTFSTADDITSGRSMLPTLSEGVEKAKSYGADAVKGLYRSAKERIVGKQKEAPDAPADADPDEGSNP